MTSRPRLGYHNQDLSLVKNTSLGGGTNLQFRIEAFNLWNWHIFTTAVVATSPRAVGVHHRHREPRLRQVERPP